MNATKTPIVIYVVSRRLAAVSLSLTGVVGEQVGGSRGDMGHLIMVSYGVDCCVSPHKTR